jgi:hypothetical protein
MATTIGAKIEVTGVSQYQASIQMATQKTKE